MSRNHVRFFNVGPLSWIHHHVGE